MDEGKGEESALRNMREAVCTIALLILILIGGCSPTRTAEQKVLGRYYIDFRDVAENWDGPFDERGIPLRDYGNDFGIQYQPVGIAHYALGNWDLWLETQDNQYKVKFLKMADWFCENLVSKGDFGVWEYKFDYPRFQLKAPWPSAMSQGEGISILVRAYQLTEDERYLECAQGALGSFKASLEEGGVRYRDERGFIWYEEYPSLVKPPHVLNGFIFALFGLYDFYKITGSKEALSLFNEGIETLKANLGQWDLGIWSRYDLTNLYGQDTYLFRFVTDKTHPNSPHPFDMIVLQTVTNSGAVLQIKLDVGAEDDTADVATNSSRLYYSPEYQDWGERYYLDGRTVRNYENLAGKWAHAPFEFIINLQPSYKYSLEITYKDITNEPVYVELYADGVKYVRFADLQSIGDGAWKTVTVKLPFDLLLLKKGASTKYHEWHIRQLDALSDIIMEKVFKDYAEYFAVYLKAVSSNLWWQDMLKEIRDALEER